MQSALQSLPGVTNVKVDFPNRLANCTVDPDQFDAGAAIAKLVDAGYDQAKLAVN